MKAVAIQEIEPGVRSEFPDRKSGRWDGLGQRLQEIAELADFYRIDACRRLAQSNRSNLGQFLTPLPVATQLGGLFREHSHDHVVLLDAGAGVGSLAATAVQRLLTLRKKPQSLHIVAWEIEPVFQEFLGDILSRLCHAAEGYGIRAGYEIRTDDFLDGASKLVGGDLFSNHGLQVTHAILNPPFRKISTHSLDRSRLSGVGIECTNLYAAFVWLAGRMLCPQGEIAAITPRSFCNGPYFRPFRLWLLSDISLDHFIMVNERNLAFSDDEVLQETILYHGVRGAAAPKHVFVETASGAELEDLIGRHVPFSEFVLPNDPETFFHLTPDGHQDDIRRQVESLPYSLEDLGLNISTGRVVDFRAKDYLRRMPEDKTVPLIYPQHLAGGKVGWPVPLSKKCNAILDSPATESLLVPMGTYVLLRRFTTKEEKRRVVATVFEPVGELEAARAVGFENHLNYFHSNGRPLDPVLARGLAAFLNSSVLDEYFRQFNGHTQVNATDLRRMPFPSKEQLVSLGLRCADIKDQSALDHEVAQILAFMPSSTNALKGSKRIKEALAILKTIGAPREQQNERSALVLLALAGIKPATPWKHAANPMLGVTKIMDSIRANYGKAYAPNTRETIRRFSVHQFVQMGLLIQNPDDPQRAVNSPDNVYQMEAGFLALLRMFGSGDWSPSLVTYQKTAGKIRALRETERAMNLIPVKLPAGETVRISAGGQNELIKSVVEQFCPRFTPGGVVLYLGDAGKKFIVDKLGELAVLGVTPDEHGKMPDLVIHDENRNWLVLIEAVTSHGPMNLKRKNELRTLFAGSKAGLVFVTAFATRSDMVRFLPEISWETEVWVADAPSHLIHFNGERFLGPYEAGGAV
jgi:adenine-specific DNA-methyltransferase